MSSRFPAPASIHGHRVSDADGVGWHGRSGILAQLRQLQQARERGRLDSPGRAAVWQAVGFFDRVMAEHHREEEEELFPAVQAASRGAQRERAIALACRLTEKHRRLESLWALLSPRLQRLTHDPTAAVAVTELEPFVRAVKTHARLEESAYLPLACEVLGGEPLGLDIQTPAQDAPLPGSAATWGRRRRQK